MKDQYFGDVNDYRKYGLLRASAGAGLSIGVCWFLTEPDGRNDGEFRTYLTKPTKWRPYDPDLFEALRRLQEPGVARGVRRAAEWGLIPGATYFDEVVTDEERRRHAYFQAAVYALRGCELLFFDPDNGIEVPSTRRGRRGSARYVYWAELREAYANGHSLLVYQHFPRVERNPFVSFLAGRLGEELGAPRVSAFVTSHVAFFLAHQAGHVAALEKAVEAVRARWQGQIEVGPA